MQDLGKPSSYLAVKKGIPVFASDGELLGRVVEVLCAPNLDMFDGVIFDTTAGPGGHRFVDAPEVARTAEKAVTLSISGDEVATLPPPDSGTGMGGTVKRLFGGFRRR